MKTTRTRHGQTAVPAEIRKRHNLREGYKLIWIDDGQVVKMILTDSDIVKALKGSGKGYRLTEPLLAERRAEYKRNGNTSLQIK